MMAPVFQCVTCKESFARLTNLRRHASVHKDLNACHECQDCDFITRRKDNLTRHIANYHKQPTLKEEKGDDDKQDQRTIDNNRHVKSHVYDQLPAVNAPNAQMSKMVLTPVVQSFDKRFQLPHNFLYIGATQSGKTSLLMKTLENARKLYNPIPKRVFFLFSCFQHIYETLKEKLSAQGINCEFIKASTVSEADIDYMADPNGGQTLIIIDDSSISAASSPQVAQVFTMARHKNCSIILLLHFIFGPWPSARIISANTAYFLLMKSPRLTRQVAMFGSQLGRQKTLVSAYAREMQKPYGYVLLDLCTSTPEYLWIRTDIFNENSNVMLVVQTPPVTAHSLPYQNEESPKRSTTDVNLLEASSESDTSKKQKRPWIKWNDDPGATDLNTVLKSKRLWVKAEKPQHRKQNNRKAVKIKTAELTQDEKDVIYLAKLRKLYGSYNDNLR